MRNAGKVVAEALAIIEQVIKPGISTVEIDKSAPKRPAA